MPDTQNIKFGKLKKIAAISAISLLIVLFLIVVFMPSVIAPWSRLNNYEEEIDLYSGQARVSRYFLYCQVSQEIKDTPLSKVLNKKFDKENWVHVNTFQPLVSNSPHFVYHGAFAQANYLARLWEVYEFEPAACKKTAEQLLKVLREGGNYGAADKYFNLIYELANKMNGKPIIEKDIPDDLADSATKTYKNELKRDNSSYGD